MKFFRSAMSLGHVRSAYSLGLILRDSSEEEAVTALEYAARQRFMPAIQELMSAEEMKKRYGEPLAEQLKQVSLFSCRIYSNSAVSVSRLLSLCGFFLSRIAF